MRRIAACLVVAGVVAGHGFWGTVSQRAAALESGQWEHVAHGSPFDTSQHQALAVAGDGSIYVAGWSGQATGTGVDYASFLRKYDPAGAVAWTTNVTELTASQAEQPPDLVVDGLGNPYLRVCAPNCRLAVYDPATGDEVDAISDPGIQNPWPLVGVRAGGVLVVARVTGATTTLAARRLDSALDETFSFDLTGTLDADDGTWLVETASGAFLAIGAGPASDTEMPIVQIGADGGHLGTTVHTGGIPFSASWAARPMRSSPVSAGPHDHVWVAVDPPGGGFDRRVESFTATGSRAGLVDVALPQEQVVTPSGLAACNGEDVGVLYGGLLTGTNDPARFSKRTVGSRTFTVLRCDPLVGGDPVSMLAVYSTASPLGGAYVREAAIPFPAQSSVAETTVDGSGAVVMIGWVAGSTSSLPFLLPRNPFVAPGHATGSPSAATVRNPAGDLAVPSELTPLTPVRLFDTRGNEPHGLVQVPKSPIATGGELRVRVNGVGGVPTNGVAAVSLNVTATDPAGAGFVTVHPCGVRPTASNLNFSGGQTVANAVVAPVSSTGEICFYSHVQTELLADVNGWFRAGGGFQPVTPIRVFDSRPNEPAGAIQITKQHYGGGKVLAVRMADVPGVPASASAVSLNVTVTEPVDSGFLTVYPCGDRPLASNLNFTAGQTVPNAVITPLGPDSVVCIYAHADTHVIADLNGYFDAPTRFAPVSPTRVFDTRPGEPDGGVVVAKQKVGPADILTVSIAGVAGVPPTGVGAVTLNVTVTNPDGPGYVTVFPCGDRPLASNVNFVAGATVPNAVVAPVAATGQICFYAHAPTDLIADVTGWFPS